MLNIKNEELLEPFKHNFDYYFYHKYISYLEDKHSINLIDIINYIKDNNVILKSNDLVLYLFEKRLIDIFI